jgi:hypothetical protein
MPISEIYTGTSSASLATTSITALCALTAPTTKRGWLVGVRVSLGVSAAAAGYSCLFQLYRLTNASSVSGTTSNVTYPNDPAGPTTSLCTFSTIGAGWSTPPTGNVNCLWQQEIPQTTGSSWEEFPPLGYEYGLNTTGAVGGLALWVTCSVATASTAVYSELVWSE